jgi:hypothetical protein
MSTVKRISPGSAFKVGLVIYGFIGLIGGIFVGVAGLFGTLFPAADQSPLRGVLLGAIAVGAPIAYAVFGGIIAALSALVYNVAARCVGGLQVEIT